MKCLAREGLSYQGNGRVIMKALCSHLDFVISWSEVRRANHSATWTLHTFLWNKEKKKKKKKFFQTIPETCPQYTDAPAVGYLTIKLQNSTWYRCLNLSLTGSLTYVCTYTFVQTDVHSYACNHVRKTEKTTCPRHHPMRGHKNSLMLMMKDPFRHDPMMYLKRNINKQHENNVENKVLKSW